MPDINLHGLIPRSLVNGPGERFVIHVQGCSRNCPGCFNRDSLPNEPRILMPIDELIRQIISTEGIQGISLSGGEPLEQMDACIELMREVKQQTDLSVLVYSGFTLEEIKGIQKGDEFLGFVDILIDGPYKEELKCETGILASSNQRVVFLSEKYSHTDVELPGDFEIHIHPDGHTVATGLPPEMEML